MQPIFGRLSKPLDAVQPFARRSPEPMNYRAKHEKFAKTISTLTKDTLIDNLSSLEYAMLLPAEEEPRFWVPREANFQLPNVFLRTKIDPQAEKLLTQPGQNVDWKDNIDRLVGHLDDIQLEDEEGEESEEAPEDEELLEALIKMRYGTYGGTGPEGMPNGPDPNPE